MIRVEVVRLCQVDGATLGAMIIDGYPEFSTLEPPWRDNKICESCIPVGEYRAHSLQHQKYGKTFLVEHVPGRSGILIHQGNFAKDTEGCILVGSGYSRSEQGAAIRNSEKAMNRFREMTKGAARIRLIIR